MRQTIVLTLLFLSWGLLLKGQTCCTNLTISQVYDEADTVGISSEQLSSLECSYVLSTDVVDSNVRSFKVEMGLTLGEGELLDGTFSTTENEAYTDGSSVTVDGSHVEIDLGKFTGLTEFKIRLYALNDMGGVLSMTDLTYPSE